MTQRTPYDPNWNSLANCRARVQQALTQQRTDFLNGQPVRRFSDYQLDVLQQQVNERHIHTKD